MLRRARSRTTRRLFRLALPLLAATTFFTAAGCADDDYGKYDTGTGSSDLAAQSVDMATVDMAAPSTDMSVGDAATASGG